jgi:hypothetical protein
VLVNIFICKYVFFSAMLSNLVRACVEQWVGGWVKSLVVLLGKGTTTSFEGRVLVRDENTFMLQEQKEDEKLDVLFLRYKSSRIAF